MAVKEHIFGNNIKWIDVVEPTREELEGISKEHNFNRYLLFDCLDPDHLPKYEFNNNIHFLIVRYYNHSIEKRIATTQELTSKVAAFYKDDLIVTVHRSDVHFLNDIKNKHLENNDIETVSDFVANILKYTLTTYEDPVYRLSEQVDFHETHIFLKTIEPEQLEALYFIKQKATLCQRVLMLMLQPINHACNTECESTAINDVRDLHLKITTLYNSVLEDVSNLMNMYLSLAAQKTNDVMKVLTIFSVFFMPLTFIVGVYGMNFEYMPELKHKWGYPFVIILMAITVAMVYYWFKRKRWL